MDKSKTSFHRGLAAGLTAASIWGGMYVVSKLVLDVIPPLSLLSLRLMLGSGALGLFLKMRGAWSRLERGQLTAVLGVGALGYGLSMGLQFLGTRLSTATNGAVVTAATPAFVYLFAAAILHERISSKKWLALLIATIGVIAVVDPRQASLDPETWQGNLSLVGAALTWALFSVLVRRLTRDIGALPFTFLALNGGLLLAVPIAIGELSRAPLASLDMPTALGVLYLGLISTALAAYLWNLAFEELDAGTASLTFFAQPLVGAALGSVLLGEQLTGLFLLGGALILTGIYLATRFSP